MKKHNLLLLIGALVLTGCGGSKKGDSQSADSEFISEDSITSETTPTSEEEQKAYTRVDDMVYFGSYPQSKVADEELIASLNVKAGDLPTSTNTYAWEDYGYYYNGNVESYMFYIDIDNNNDGANDYRGVYFTKYRGQSTTAKPTEAGGDTYQDDNGYSLNTVYWFKYETISWHVIYEKDGKAQLFSEYVLDAQEFYHDSTSEEEFEHNGGTGYANNYELSDLRKYLNGSFYKGAFDPEERTIIQTTTVENSKRTTSSTGEPYVCADTEDKVYAHAFWEPNYSSGELRSSTVVGKPTDYSLCQGLQYMDVSGFVGVSWFSRSPFNNAKQCFKQLPKDVDMGGAYVSGIYDAGVRPGLWIEL